MITTSELKQALDNQSITLIDVRLPDDYTEEQITGAINHCVFEVSFLSSIEEQFPDKSTAIGVYGASENSHESRMAVEKLSRAGYQTVFEYRAGLEEWKQAGLPTTTGATISPQPVLNGTHQIDLTESRLEWLGRNLINKHWGTLGLKSGQIDFTDGMITGGEFVIDMEQIECIDLAGNPIRDVLIAHLKNDDFFDTELYPEARLVIESAERIDNKGPGEPNLRLHGTLTMKGITRKISFNTTAGFTDTGKAAAQSAFAIDRTHWNIIYGSGKFFNRLAGHLVNDLIELQIRIITQ